MKQIIILPFSCVIQTKIHNVFYSHVFLLQICLDLNAFCSLVITLFCQLAGVLIVTTPQDVALNDVRREVIVFSKVEVPVCMIISSEQYF